MIVTREQLVARLRRAGELEVSGEDQAETDSYFDTRQFRFHGPDVFEADYPALPTISRPFAQRWTIAPFAGGSSSPRMITSPAKPGSRGHFSVSSHHHRRALCLGTANVWSGTC